MREPEERFEAARRAMMAEIEAEVVETGRWLGKERLDPRVLDALARVPRHRFAPAALQEAAYDNQPLPIGHGQTISQPYIVAVMSDLAALGPADKVLEVGTGCGYQAAVLAELAGRVISLETVPALAESAAARLRELGYRNVEVRQADGARGWPAEAPYDAIVVTAAAEGRIPPALIAQLAPGGRLVIPVDYGAPRGFWRLGRERDQQLLLVVKQPDGEIAERRVLPVAFVPLIEQNTEPVETQETSQR